MKFEVGLSQKSDTSDSSSNLPLDSLSAGWIIILQFRYKSSLVRLCSCATKLRSLLCVLEWTKLAASIDWLIDLGT